MRSPFTPYVADDARYSKLDYVRTGRSGLDLPAVSLGLWHNFGDDVPFDRQRDILRRAFDLGVTHFDLANNYGPPYGAAETNFGRHLADDFRPYRDELVRSGDRLALYPGNGPGGLTGRSSVGIDVSGYDWVVGVSDLRSSGHADLLAREKATGLLWALQGSAAKGITSRRLLGEGMGGYDLAG